MSILQEKLLGKEGGFVKHRLIVSAYEQVCRSVFLFILPIIDLFVKMEDASLPTIRWSHSLASLFLSCSIID